MTAEQLIIVLSNKRYEYINEQEESWDEEQRKYSKDFSEAIDHLGDAILDKLKSEFNCLPFDFILVELTKLGHSPNLIYDDNGHFAISGDGFQSSSVDEAADFKAVVFIEKDAFADSPKDALRLYLFSE